MPAQDERSRSAGHVALREPRHLPLQVTTLIGFTLVYAGLGLLAVRLFLRIGRQGPVETDEPDADPWLYPGHDDDGNSAAPLEPALVD